MNTVSCEIKCLICDTWFNAPIQFGDSKSFFGSITKGNTTICPNEHITPCNKDNMRFQERDGNGKVIYEEGKDTFQ